MAGHLGAAAFTALPGVLVTQVGYTRLATQALTHRFGAKAFLG